MPVICRTYQIMKLCLDKTSTQRSIAQTNVLERRCYVCGNPTTDLHRGCLAQAPSQSHPVETFSIRADHGAFFTLGLDELVLASDPVGFCRSVESVAVGSPSVPLGWRSCHSMTIQGSRHRCPD